MSLMTFHIAFVVSETSGIANRCVCVWVAGGGGGGQGGIISDMSLLPSSTVYRLKTIWDRTLVCGRACVGQRKMEKERQIEKEK